MAVVQSPSVLAPSKTEQVPFTGRGGDLGSPLGALGALVDVHTCAKSKRWCTPWNVLIANGKSIEGVLK
jgi:hypothetical protein